MEHRREFKEEVEIVDEGEDQGSPEVHRGVLYDTTPQTRDVSFQGRGRVGQTGPPISASLGAMRTLVWKLDMLLLAPPPGCSSESVKLKMQLLKEDVEEISSCLDTLSQLEDPPETARCWMNEVRDLSYNMEDYIDRLHVRAADPSLAADNIKTTKSHRRWFSRVRTPKKVPWDEQHFDAYTCAVGHMLPTPMPYEETSDIVINDRMNEFIHSLTNDGADQQQLKVVSVLGSACLGKTTLARVLYNRIGLQFDCRAFIRVSKKPDMKKIFQDMLSQLEWQPYQLQYGKEVDLINTIKKYLQDKRYLIIIGDVWSASVWDSINRAFPKVSHGSRIITTTQIEDVAVRCCRYLSEQVFEMKPLDDCHSRKLFFNRLFGSESNCPEQLKNVSNEIVALCGGLPLATISIASLLASQPVTTEDLLKHIHESLSSLFSANPTSERTRQALNLSFNNLPQYLKTCLLYVSMYQEGYTFCKNDLVKQWMAEGFIHTTKGEDTEKVAESYLHQLISRKFIQPMRIDYNNEVFSCAVHDVVHDLIAQKSAEDNFIVAIDNGEKNVALSHKVRRLSILFGDARYAKAPTYIIKSQVRSLTFWGLFECMPSITEFKLVRVLNLHLSGHRHGDQDPTIDLTGISELFHLRYLKIVCDVCMKLPSRMRGLQCLETLDVMHTTRGTDVPLDIICLPHLLHLCLPADTNLLDSSVSLVSLGKLNHLQDLYISTPPSSNSDHLQRSVEVLGSLISGHDSLKTIKVVAHGSSVRYGGASIETIGWFHLTPPPHLQRFELSPHSRIIFDGIPWSIEQVGNLSILKIAVKGLSIDDVETLRGMPALTALSLYVETAPFIKITFGKVGFSALKYFKLKCMSGIAWLKFEADAMPTLWKLKLVYNASPRMEQHQHGTAVIIIDHMPSLKEVSVKFRGAAADVEYALRTFVSNHPSNPTINMQPMDYSSYGEENTTHKHQQDEIMEEEPDEYYKEEPDKIVEEEPDEYDKTLERPADERIIIMPPESSSRLHVPGDGSQSIQQDVSWEASSRYPPEWVGSHEFSLDELMSATSNFSEENLLGKSILGSIYKGTIDGKIMVAITKLTYHRSLHPERIMHHPHMVRLLGYCHQDAHNIYVYEYMPRGSLKCHLLETNLIASLPWLTRLKIAVGAAKGLSFLHESVKRRLSGAFGGSSILLASDYTAKLWGFVLAMQSDVMLREIQKSDNVYQFGVVLLELLSGRPHFGGKRLGPKRDLVKWSCPYLLSEDKLHHIMDPILEGQYSLSAAWRTATIARLCLNSVLEEQPSMRDVVEALESLLNDDKDDC